MTTFVAGERVTDVSRAVAANPSRVWLGLLAVLFQNVIRGIISLPKDPYLKAAALGVHQVAERVAELLELLLGLPSLWAGWSCPTHSDVSLHEVRAHLLQRQE